MRSWRQRQALPVVPEALPHDRTQQVRANPTAPTWSQDLHIAIEFEPAETGAARRLPAQGQGDGRRATLRFVGCDLNTKGTRCSDAEAACRVGDKPRWGVGRQRARGRSTASPPPARWTRRHSRCPAAASVLAGIDAGNAPCARIAAARRRRAARQLAVEVTASRSSARCTRSGWAAAAHATAQRLRERWCSSGKAVR